MFELTDLAFSKSIDVYPRDLLPQIENGSSLPTKRVDYSIGLEFTTHTAWKEIVRRLQDRTLNQSDSKMIRDRILCSHIEVKTSTGGSIEGRNQLALWCAAGYKKLDSIWVDLHADNIAPHAPPMPLWLWTGRDVQLMVAIRRANTIHVLDKKQWTINDMSSLTDVIDTFTRVIDWGWDHYRPWLLRTLGAENLPLPATHAEAI